MQFTILHTLVWPHPCACTYLACIRMIPMACEVVETTNLKSGIIPFPFHC